MEKRCLNKRLKPAHQESFFDCLNEEEQTTLSDYLERLIKNLEEQQAEGGSGTFRVQTSVAEDEVIHSGRVKGGRLPIFEDLATSWVGTVADFPLESVVRLPSPGTKSSPI